MFPFHAYLNDERVPAEGFDILGEREVDRILHVDDGGLQVRRELLQVPHSLHVVHQKTDLKCTGGTSGTYTDFKTGNVPTPMHCTRYNV